MRMASRLGLTEDDVRRIRREPSRASWRAGRLKRDARICRGLAAGEPLKVSIGDELEAKGVRVGALTT